MLAISLLRSLVWWSGSWHHALSALGRPVLLSDRGGPVVVLVVNPINEVCISPTEVPDRPIEVRDMPMGHRHGSVTVLNLGSAVDENSTKGGESSPSGRLCSVIRRSSFARPLGRPPDGPL